MVISRMVIGQDMVGIGQDMKETRQEVKKLMV